MCSLFCLLFVFFLFLFLFFVVVAVVIRFLSLFLFSSFPLFLFSSSTTDVDQDGRVFIKEVESHFTKKLNELKHEDGKELFLQNVFVSTSSNIYIYTVFNLISIHLFIELFFFFSSFFFSFFFFFLLLLFIV